MTKNARFWVWWHDGWVKLTLRPDQQLTAFYGRYCDEGWYSYAETWTHEGDAVLRECTAESQDCDGRHNNYDDSRCPLDSLAVISHTKQTPWIEGVGCEFVDDPDAPLTPDWQDVKSSQRDQYAEMAGY